MAVANIQTFENRGVNKNTSEHSEKERENS
jgi:hypothetical protein